MEGFEGIKPIVTSLKTGKTIRRYDTKIKKAGTDDNVNVGLTPQGSVYYRRISPNKKFGSLYMEKLNGTIYTVDTFKTNEYIKTLVESSNKNIVTDGKNIIRENIPGAKNIVSENLNIGLRKNLFVDQSIKDILKNLKENIDMKGLVPRRKSFISKLIKRVF